MKNVRAWIHGLISAAVGGGANAATAAIVAPEDFNFNEGWSKLLRMFIAGAVIAVLFFLKDKPLPPEE